MLLRDVVESEYQQVVELPDETLVLCKKIPGGPFRAFDRNHPEPEIPLRQTTVIGGATVMEPDPTDPEYVKELEQFENDRASDFMELAWDFMQVIDRDESQEIERREKMTRWGLACSEYDKLDCYLLIGTDGEIAGKVKILTEKIMELSTVTKGGLAKAKDSFQPDVDGDAGDEIGISKEQAELRDGEAVSVS